ncbi:hypothetical protein Syun_023219 [Stephania yunnanensis]|uniref:Uncharacterized protein n=1 Tax=Stephania yunnanensis TaxID=152371 RepID=A0AAP0FG27_9MAGN
MKSRVSREREEEEGKKERKRERRDMAVEVELPGGSNGRRTGEKRWQHGSDGADERCRGPAAARGRTGSARTDRWGANRPAAVARPGSGPRARGVARRGGGQWLRRGGLAVAVRAAAPAPAEHGSADNGTSRQQHGERRQQLADRQGHQQRRRKEKKRRKKRSATIGGT